MYYRHCELYFDVVDQKWNACSRLCRVREEGLIFLHDQKSPAIICTFLYISYVELMSSSSESESHMHMGRIDESSSDCRLSKGDSDSSDSNTESTDQEVHNDEV